MPIFQITGDSIQKVGETTFREQGMREREDLQRLLRKKIDIIDENVLVIAEEFGDWEDSKRRIDLLGVDKDANLVVVELKRTEDGGHMELQAIRYAAMVSTMTFDKAVEVYTDYLEGLESDLDARSSLLEFLGWSEPNDDLFNKDVRIVLVSADFSKELTTAVLWLIDRDIDIRCIRIKPYAHNGQLLVDVQPIIPLPEATVYQTGVREKSRKERIARESSRDLTRYDVTVNGDTEEKMSKRQAILRIVKHLCASGITPEQMTELLPWRSLPWRRKHLFQSIEGTVDSAKFVAEIRNRANQEGRPIEAKRYFCDQDDLIHANGRTYALTKRWGGKSTAAAIATLLKAFPDKGFSCKVSGRVAGAGSSSED
jgi:hypothetical protein